MKEQQTFENFIAPRLAPDFDDERTLLSAQPVVPLDRINSKLKHRRRWFLGGAFAVAMLLGAASALLAAYFRMRDVPDSEVSKIDLPSSSVVAEETFANFLPEIQAEPVKTVTPVKRLATRPRLVTSTNHSVSSPSLSEEEELRRIRTAVLIDQWEERRMRRATRRERRRADRYGRDLSNVNEIFEGPSRPQ